MSKYIIIAVLLTSCTKYHVNNFTCKPNKMPLANNISGVYYSYDETKNYIDVIFAYSNGMIKLGGLGQVKNLNEINLKNKIDSFVYQIANFKKKYKIVPFDEGGYCIEGNKLKIQNIRYIPQFTWGVMEREAKLLNDSTFIVYKEIFTIRKVEKNDTLIFRKIRTQKPDSLLFNDWKNKKWYWAK